MSLREAPALPDGIVPAMFHTSRRLRALEGLLRRLPRPLAEQFLAGAAMADAVMRPARFRQVRAWAAAQPLANRPPWRLAFAILANHGRFCGEEALVGVPDQDALRRHTVLSGAEHLRAARDGAILLGFHLGPPRAWVRLRALGHPVRMAGRFETSVHDPRWSPAFDARDAVRLPGGEPRERLPGLYQIRQVLRDGALVLLTADGPFGREAFRLDLPGRPLIVRRGWLALRRLVGVPTLPMLAHRDGPRYVITVHPPLPPSVGDLERDAVRCRSALAPLVETFVRQFPEQCRYLAFPPWGTPVAARRVRGGGALDSGDRRP